MAKLESKHNYLVDEEGNRVAVVLDIATYKKFLEESEELASISGYDEGVLEIDQAIPFELALKEIRNSNT
ncbi:hypothetical protein P3G55_06805 [Leptospira sp. 96542]|nr:hypothetical protein [Leptospira sp. 96542]